MKTKSFDVMEMKRRGQEALQARLESMTAEERLEFWRQQNQGLREWQRQLRAQREERGRFERAMEKVADVEPKERGRY